MRDPGNSITDARQPFRKVLLFATSLALLGGGGLAWLPDKAVDASGSTRKAPANQIRTNIAINGQQVPLPPDEHLRKTIRSNTSLTTVNVRVHYSSHTDKGGVQAPQYISPPTP